MHRQGDLYSKHVGGEKYLIVNTYRGQIRVHVRQFASRENGSKMYPTKVGVAMSAVRFANLMEKEHWITGRVEADLTEENGEHVSDTTMWHIGGGLYAVVNKEFKLVHLRQYWNPPGTSDICPTKVGVAIKLDQWYALVEDFKQIRERFQELKDAKVCYQSDDHANQMGYMECLECTPFGELSPNITE